MFKRESDEPIELEEVKEEFGRLQDQIQQLLDKTRRDFDNVMHDRDNLDESFLHSEYYSIAYKLQDIDRRLTYLAKPVVDQGLLTHNSAGRYELPSGYYFTSGSDCEILADDHGEQYWLYTTIEHNGEDYYATALGRDVSIKGLFARIRR